MWYTISCPHCGRRFTYFTERDEYAAVNGLYPILEKHDTYFRHHDGTLERSEVDVKYWIRRNMVRTFSKDNGAYLY